MTVLQIFWLVVLIFVAVWMITSGAIGWPPSALMVAMLALGVHAMGGTGQIK